MKKITFLFLLLFSTLVSFSQKCKIIEERDSFTGEIVKYSKIRIIESSGMLTSFWSIRLIIAKNKYQVNVEFQRVGELNTSSNIGDSLMIKLSSGEVVVLNSSQKASPRSSVITTPSTNVTTYYDLFFDLNEIILGKLAQNKIIQFRMNISDLVYNADFDDGKAEKFRIDADCIMKSNNHH